MSDFGSDSKSSIDASKEEELLRTDDEGDGEFLIDGGASFTDDDSNLTDEESELSDESKFTDDESKPSDKENGPSEEADNSDEQTFVASQEPSKETVSDSLSATSVSSTEDDRKSYLEKYKKILADVAANENCYPLYKELINSAYEIDDLEHIITSHTMFANKYPLSPAIWEKYLVYYMSAQLDSRSTKMLLDLFHTAFTDYYSELVANLFFRFFRGHGCDIQTALKVLRVYGSHYYYGAGFYDCVRDSIYKDEDLNEFQKTKLCFELYNEQLQYPSADYPAAFEQYDKFCSNNRGHLVDDLTSEKVKAVHEKINYANKIDLVIRKLEAKIVSIDYDDLVLEEQDVLLLTYRRYLKVLDKFENGPVIHHIRQSVYERSVATYCLLPETWAAYMDYLSFTEPNWPSNNFNVSALDVAMRSLRNCTWSDKLYTRCIHFMEKERKPNKEVQCVLEMALDLCFETPEPIVAIWLVYLGFLKRRTDFTSEDSVLSLRKNFNWAWTVLGQKFGVLADCNCEILQMWATLEYEFLHNPSRGYDLWSTVMESADNCAKSHLWLQYASLEAQYNKANASKIYRRALYFRLDDRVAVLDTWLLFERCYGDVDSLIKCQNIVNVQLTNMMNIEAHSDDAALQQERPEADFSQSNEKASRKRYTASDTAGGEDEDEAPPPKKTKVKTSQPDAATAIVNQGTVAPNKDNVQVFLSNLDYKLDEADIREALDPFMKIKSVDLLRSSANKNKSRGCAYMELETEADAQKALSMDRHLIKDRPVYISPVERDPQMRRKFQYSDSLEPNKLFVKNLPKDCTTDELTNIFGKYGKVVDVRMAYFKSGQFKGIAYVEYASEAEAGKGLLGTNLKELRGQMISVAISEPPSKRAWSSLASTSSRPAAKASTTQKLKLSYMGSSLIPTQVRKNIANADANKASTSYNPSTSAPPAYRAKQKRN